MLTRSMNEPSVVSPVTAGKKRKKQVSVTVLQSIAPPLEAYTSAKDVAHAVKDKTGITINRSTASRISGGGVDERLLRSIHQYARLQMVVDQAHVHDPDGTYILGTQETPYAQRAFKYIYLAPFSAKQYWVHDHRLMFAVDGAFISSPWRETLFLAVAKDANDELHILAFMVAENESEETYGIFFDHMERDFERFRETWGLSGGARSRKGEKNSASR